MTSLTGFVALAHDVEYKEAPDEKYHLHERDIIIRPVIGCKYREWQTTQQKQKAEKEQLFHARSYEASELGATLHPGGGLHQAVAA